MAKCTPPARGDLSLTRLLADLYRPASIFQATSILISPSINVLGEEKFSTSCFVATRDTVHPWELALLVSKLMFNSHRGLQMYQKCIEIVIFTRKYVHALKRINRQIYWVTEWRISSFFFVFFFQVYQWETTEEMASLPRANIKEPSIVKYYAKVQETTPAAMEGQTKGGREKRSTASTCLFSPAWLALGRA